jgi:hypothetical protein
MVTVTIGAVEATIDQADQGWINQQINRRREDGANVCVRVRIEEPDVSLMLSTPTCGSGAGGSRALTTRESRIVELWRDRGLTERTFASGSVVAFLQQLKRLL